ncbi:hypothetical protein O9H85_09840 [Paenibacillus filicis]|uniref:Uncharacterized protein n=1 Tax=Paenibacillus gyeongsangnamensis TaxID=3388067 RepID=A0ABT4Q7M3_9BACL|nr:hypothetical protein [Paenibacillus filicis]MCZ8512710.1 hypothetical protein [Paenibacillus filicis]
MLSRRKEPFRYVFAVSAKGLFSIREVDGRDISSRSAEASMVNFHKSGCRIRSVLDLNAEEHDIKLLLSYTLSGYTAGAAREHTLAAADGERQRLRHSIRVERGTEERHLGFATGAGGGKTNFC